MSTDHLSTRYRVPPSAMLRDTGVVAVLRAEHADEYAPVIDALVAGGVRSIELTLSTRGVVEALPRLLAQVGDAAEIGVGTVTTAGQLHEVVGAGAAYVVTPVTTTDLLDAAQEHDVPFYPGGLSPTELGSGWAGGATAVKLFPASVVGPGYLAQLRGPFPDLEVVPSGGIGVDDVAAWIDAGCLAVSLGGPLLRDCFAGGSLAELEERARRVRGIVDRAREAR